MSTVSSPGRRLALPHLSGVQHRLKRPRISPRRLAVLGVIVLVLFGGWLWFRSSSLVAIRQVRVTGLSGANVNSIRSTLAREARTMTTLNVSTAKLTSSVSGFSHIAGISVSTGFPHAVTIAVHETIPVATVTSDGRQVAVDGAGLLLPGQSTSGLPRLPAAPDAAGSRVSSTGTLAALAVLGAAPYQLLGHIASAVSTAAHGVVISLSNGPQLYFGNATQMSAKWAAALAVLANANSAGASYIDVSSPDRPAAGT